MESDIKTESLANPPGQAGGGSITSRYRVLDRLGEGGMGEVFRAEQKEPVRRLVALKLIKRGMDSKEIVARFESERQALAMMNHPNIAKVLDAGTTEQGRPFFAMELVEGEPINRYCDKHRLSTVGRLGLFIDICQGVQHAHQKGIIHRDLKPSNVLVKLQDDKPVPKIIDFGVAKATAQPLTDQTMFTRSGQIVGTLEYMSPEQAEMTSLDIDTRTDVYSLGVLLYELLVGTLPFDYKELRKTSFDEIRRVICEVEPSRPSTRISTLGDAASNSAEKRSTEPVALAKRLRGDLDWIVMKALEKDRTRRYASASEMADDLRRHLNDEPVRARPPSASYRIGKFIRRNKAVVAAGSLVALALVIGVIGTGIGLVRARRAETFARLEAERANQQAATSAMVSSFLVDMFQVLDPSAEGAGNITAREILEDATVRARRELSDEPLVLARLLQTIGNVHRNLGLYHQARPLLEEALAIREDQLGENHPDVATSLSDLGRLLWISGDYHRARPLLERALAIREAALGPDHPDVATSLNNLANLVADSESYANSIPLYRRALDIQERAFGPDHTEVAVSVTNLAIALQYTDDYEGARPLYERALAIDEKARGPEHPYVATGLDNLAQLLRLLGEYDEARSLAQRALDIRVKVLGPDHRDVATGLENLADLARETGDFETARANYEQALEIFEKSLGSKHTHVARCLNNLANLLRDAGELAEAGSRYRRSLQIQEEKLGPNHPYVAQTLEDYSESLRKEGRTAEADAMAQRAEEIRKNP